MSNKSNTSKNNLKETNSSGLVIIKTINISNYDINPISIELLKETVIKKSKDNNKTNNEKPLNISTIENKNKSNFDKENSIDNILNNTYKQNLLNNTLKNNINSRVSNYTKNQTKGFLPETIKLPLINKDVNTHYALFLGILVPFILIGLIIIICYFIKKRMKLKMSSSNDNLDQNKLQMKNYGAKQPYNRIQNTSGLNNILQGNPNNLSEIKVQNLKEEINNIISNTSGSSSGRRKRDKKKSTNKNAFDEKKDQIGIQNEIKEQIKQYVIDEHNNI